MSGLAASAVVATGEAWRAAPLLAALRAQDGAERLEVVIAAPAAEHAALEAMAGTGFAATRFLDRDPLADLPGTRAALARACAGPVVLPTETHCLPDPGWAAALVRAHAAGAAAAGPLVHNANPRSPWSAAQFAMHFGTFAPGAAARATSTPRHNTSFRRDVLAGLDAELPALYADEAALHERIRARGGRIVLAPEAQVWHVNASCARAALRHAWLGGRIYGAARSRGWGRGRRLAYALAWPLIALRRLPREVPAERWDGGRDPAGLAALTALLAQHSLGEGAGALTGTGRATVARYTRGELRRDLDLRGSQAAERRLVEAAPA